MKVKDIVEYGMLDEPAIGVSRAGNRNVASKTTNQNKRLQNRTTKANANNAIGQQQAQISQKRKKVAPTGIPARLMQPGS